LAHGGFPADELPLEIEVKEGRAEVSQAEAERRLNLVVEIPIDRTTLRLERHTGVRPAENHNEELAAIDVPERGVAGVVARQVSDAVAFITRCPMTMFGKAEAPELIPDDVADVAALDRFGTRLVYWPLSGRAQAVMRLPLVQKNLAALYERAAGIRLYADALRMGTSAGQLREFWRVLEAAFGAKGDELVGLLSECGVATDMEFTPAELRNLLVLRGRASHASSRAEIEEVAAVEREAAGVVGRLQGLAESLIVRKADWGMRTVAVDSGAPRYPYARRDGTVVFFQRPASESEPS
jgi:hypothetical protein